MKKEEVTLKNTKAEILDALNAALEREKNLSSLKSNPEKEEKQKQKQKAIENSRENVEQKVFSDELNKKFQDLELAINSQEEKLKELYGVENELANLTLVVNAGKDCIVDIETKKEAKSKEYKDEISKLEEEYKQKEEELIGEYNQKAKNLKIERERENEEYTYKLKRDRQIANNKWEDEKAQREEALAKSEEQTNKLLQEAQEKISYLKELEQKVESIPELLKKEYERGKKEATENINKENKFATELLKKDYTNIIDRQEDKIKALNQELEKSANLNNLLQEKLDKAYVQVKELATKTVEATGGVKIIGNGQNEVK